MHPKAGQPVTHDMLISVPGLMSAYYTNEPEPDNPEQKVHFGTSGHRGSSLKGSFNEVHILAICQAICNYRKAHDINGPLFLGMDTHALSEAAFITAVEVLAANDVAVRYQEGQGYTPTPVISRAIINFNQSCSVKADGIIITPSHNPPGDGGIKYNPPHGGPAENRVTRWITKCANTLIANELKDISHIPFSQAIKQEHVKAYDYISPYVEGLNNVLDMEAIRSTGLTIGVDPLGGAGLHYWEPIANHYNLDIKIVNPRIDPTFSFMTLDKDGLVRMDCSSPWAMQPLIQLKDKFDLAIGNDPDFDRHGIVTRQGLMNANDYLTVMADYLFCNRKQWPASLQLGKTIVTTALLDRIAHSLNIKILETPVGFKWYETGLSRKTLGFACEESAGATFLQKDGTTWTTDKDGFITGLLAAEVMATTNKDPVDYYKSLTQKYGTPLYSRIQVSASREQKLLLSRKLNADMITTSTLAGEPIQQCLTHAPGNKKNIGGIKLSTKNGWIAARPSGTESAYKIYAESFKDEKHLEQLQHESRELISSIFNQAEENA